MIAGLIKWYFKKLWWFVIFAVPFFTLWLPIMPVYDWLKPWDEAVVALKNERIEGLRWMVGFEYDYAGDANYFRKRDFVVLPSVFTTPTVYEFSEGTKTAKGLRIRPHDAFGYLLIYMFFVSFSSLVSLPRIKSLIRFQTMPNHADEPRSPSLGGPR